VPCLVLPCVALPYPPRLHLRRGFAIIVVCILNGKRVTSPAIECVDGFLKPTSDMVVSVACLSRIQQ
jgi:predicted transcriptional regulator